MIDCIQDRIWKLSPHVHEPGAYTQLKDLTKELIQLYKAQGRLTGDPFDATRSRRIGRPEEKVMSILKDKTCVVTGGMGCVGSLLVKELLKYDVNEIIILDNSPLSYSNTENVTRFDCDIRDAAKVNEIFELYRPDLVFHAAAQRDPGQAEINIIETITTNVLGTRNVLQASEAVGSVQHVIVSSTGKASRYYTEEIYAATKKIGEFVIDDHAKRSLIKCSIIRCTHILDNSLMNSELRSACERNDFVQVHSPGKYVTAQNAGEAVSLMLNALICSRRKYCKYLTVRHLAWPVESLEVALNYIAKSGRDIPIVFSGNPAGYSEKFFCGQLDWSRPEEVNLLTNYYERKFKRLNKAGDVLIARPCSAHHDVVERVLNTISMIDQEDQAKEILLDGLKDLIRDSLKTVDRSETMDILRWGLDPKFLASQKASIFDYQEIVQLLSESLAGSVYMEELEELLYHKI